jgi:hypothetical protein
LIAIIAQQKKIAASPQAIFLGVTWQPLRLGA